MGENISKYLLSQFYGLNEENFVSLPSLSSSMGTGNFESTISDGHHSKKQLIQSLKKAVYNQQLTKNENKFHNQLSSNMGRKSPHILTIDDIVNENEIDEVSQDFSSDGNVIVDLINNKITSTKNFPKPEDTKAAPSKTSEANNTLIINNSIPKLPSASVKMVKKLWRQKTMLLKENFNYLSKMNGNHLDLNSAGINHFPQEILQLTNLQMLYLDFNNLTILPDEIFTTLKYLKWLDLRNNQLISIPASIKGHESLETLLLQRNNIEKLPLELGLVPNLKNLQTARNPLIYPSQDILDLDCSEIIHFLRNEWKKAQPDESLIKLNTLNQNKIEQKPSTIICYQMNSKKVLNNTKHQNTRLLKPSVRSKSWNYKPSSRYEFNRSGWILKKTDNYGNNVDNNIVIRNFCTATLHRKGILYENADTGANAYDYENGTIDKITRKIKNIRLGGSTRQIFSTFSSVKEANVLHLLGPSPRSLFIRRNLNSLLDINSKFVKLCQIKPEVKPTMDVQLHSFEKLYVISLPVNLKPTKIFDTVTSNRLKMKIKPMQLKEPNLIINFLKDSLNLKK